MNRLSCRERTFPLRLQFWFLQMYGEYLHWYRHLIERLGRDAADTVWKAAFSVYPENLVSQLLSSGWEPDPDAGEGAETKAAEHLRRFFPDSVEGVLVQEARDLVESTPPISQLRKRLLSLAMVRMSTTYEALLLLKEGFALLAESLLDRYGKSGELMVYDILIEEIHQAGFKPIAVEEFISQRRERFTRTPDILDMHSAGLEVELISSSDTEIVTHVRECEWARFYRERHPRVGYLLSCSRDDAAYRAMNPQLRLQRTTTLMEGGDRCDFRIYAVGRVEE